MTFLYAAVAASPEILEISIFDKNGKRTGRASGRLRNHEFSEVFERKVRQIAKTAGCGSFEIGAATVVDIDSGISFPVNFQTVSFKQAIDESAIIAHDCFPLHIDTIPGIKHMMPLYRGAIDKVVLLNGKLLAHVSGDPAGVYETGTGNNKNKARGISALGVISALALVDGNPGFQLQGSQLDLRDGISLDLDDIEYARRFFTSIKAQITDKIKSCGISSVAVSGFSAATNPEWFAQCGMIPSSCNIQILESLPMALAENILLETLRKERIAK